MLWMEDKKSATLPTKTADTRRPNDANDEKMMSGFQARSPAKRSDDAYAQVRRLFGEQSKKDENDVKRVDVNWEEGARIFWWYEFKRELIGVAIGAVIGGVLALVIHG